MFSQWVSRLASSAQAPDIKATQADIERVSASLLVEIARSDHNLETVEIDSIVATLQQSSSLPDEEIKSLVDTAIAEVDNAVCLHEHVRLINEQFEQEQKVALIEQMWRVAAADGDVDRYEDYTIRKLSDLLHVRHSAFIQAKLRVIEP